ncbi:MAG: hypothetical protein NTZ11_18270 [Gammaproteobacteria bacterium]|nr:hypothetical protein [Gammaproteobacteria bacterium]
MSNVIPLAQRGDRIALDHIERITTEHARMTDLLRDLHAAHYGSPAAAIRAAHEYGLDPSDRTDWRTTLRQMLAQEIDELLTEVHTPPQAASTKVAG